MCKHEHKSVYINGLSKTCTIAEYFEGLPKETLQFTDLPLDAKGMCVFHSHDLVWKRQQQCGDRFWELLHLMSNDESLKDIDCREFILTGLLFDEAHGSGTDKLPMKGEAIIALAGLEIHKPLRFQGAKFYDDLLIRDVVFHEALDFDEAAFKGIVTIERCRFKGMVSFIADCRFEHNLWMEDCHFEESADFHNLVLMKQSSITHVNFDAEVSFVGVSQVAADLICYFTEVTFGAYCSFSNTGFNSSIAFDSCRFMGETHFENTAFRKRFQLIDPLIGDKVFFVANKPGVKLFENAVDFELTENNFEPLGQIIFQQVNLFNFNGDFKSQIKSLELNHKIELREGCSLYRSSIERIFPYTRFNRLLLEDVSNALVNYFETLHQRSLQIDIVRDLENEQIKLIYHTEEALSIAELENLIFSTKANALELLVTPEGQVGGATDKPLMLDHYLQLQSLWRRYGAAIDNGLLSAPILEEIMTSDGRNHSERLAELFGLTVNVYIKNVVSKSWLQAGGDINIGDRKG